MTEQNQQSSLLGKIAAYTELLMKDPRSTIFVSLAETYRKMGHFDDAKQIVNKGLELHPDFGPAYIVLARVECQLEDFTSSCSCFERALELDPNSLAALVGYARVKLILHREEEARQLLLHARSLSPADPVINKMLLGLTPAPAEESAPVQSQPEESPSAGLRSLASSTLADLYRAQGFTEKALTLYRQLSLQNPDNLDLRRKIKELEGNEKSVETATSQETLEAQPTSVPLPSQPDPDEVDRSDEAPGPEIFLQGEQDHTSAVEDGECFDSGTSEPVVSDPIVVADVAEESSSGSVNSTIDNAETLEILNRWLANIRLRREHV